MNTKPKKFLATSELKFPLAPLAYSPEQAAYRAREMGGEKLDRQGADPCRRAR